VGVCVIVWAILITVFFTRPDVFIFLQVIYICYVLDQYVFHLHQASCGGHLEYGCYRMDMALQYIFSRVDICIDVMRHIFFEMGARTPQPLHQNNAHNLIY
jgi:hypothetical protein